MADKPFLSTAKWHQQQKRATREGASPDILEFERLLVKRMAALGVPMFAHCVVRSKELQRIEVLEGNSRDSPDDGLWPHMAFAADIIHSGKGWGLTDEQWLIVGHVGKDLAKAKRIKVRWGGDFTPLKASGLGWDPAHWELLGWKAEASQAPFPTLAKWVLNWRKLINPQV